MENFLLTYRRYILLTLLIATLAGYPFIAPVLRSIDAIAATLDIGSLSIILFAGVAKSVKRSFVKLVVALLLVIAVVYGIRKIVR